MINWTQLIENLGIFGLSTGAIALVLKALGQDFISRRFKAYEKELDIKSSEFQATLNADLETHKSKLNIEHTQYLKLHEKRLEVMTQVYEKIAELHRTMSILTARIKPIPAGQTVEEQDFEHMNAAQNAYTDFRLYYENHKIFFNEHNCGLLDKLQEKYWDSLWDGTARQRLGKSSYEYNYESAKKASETVSNQIPLIRESLEKEFRLTLGVK
jgi:hypothetical protein